MYGIISFLLYRFFRYYIYYSFVYIAYETKAITLSAFLMLIIEYIAATAVGNSANNAIERKDKLLLLISVSLSDVCPKPSAHTHLTYCPTKFHLLVGFGCCWRYRPTKAYFMYTVKVLERAAIHDHLPSIALYGLLVFCGHVSEELKGKWPVAKFLAIKLVVMFTFYQMFVFHWLEGRVIHETTYWTTTNIANGLNALAVCVEMVFFAALMFWAYMWKEYKVKEGEKHTSIWKLLWDSINMMDFIRKIGYSL
ncbi:hypothetical protein H1R20_g13936, partial [Candolleomyces eurysporus]